MTRLRRIWARIRHLDQILLDGYATLTLTPPRRKDTR